MRRILIVDDDRETTRFMSELLAADDRELITATSVDAALAAISRGGVDLLISDINLDDRRTGLDLLKTFREENPSGQVVLISGFGTLETAIEAVRAGAFDYISKPFSISEVKGTVERALEVGESGMLLEGKPTSGVPRGLLGRSAGMVSLYKQIAHAAASAAPVLIVGESGTGKELVARAVHTHGPRARDPFVAVNCGAIVDTLLESELFGHTRGAFTGAVSDARGLFEQADRGTIFLDEISETSAALQVKLLRVLEEGEVRPVGASRTVKVHARVIAATNRELEQEVGAGRFRKDLYYRLGVIIIRVPPLRERSADIPLLIAHFLDNACARAGRRVAVTPDAVKALSGYEWPGNVRELENTIERLVVFSRGGTIDVADLPEAMRERHVPSHVALFEDLPPLDELEKRYVVHVLKTVGGNRTRAADVLGIDRRTLYRMMERFGLEESTEKAEDAT
ncbi:MAG: sigma-54-dependent transcriptional regulator [Acidobacteriota bacterium]